MLYLSGKLPEISRLILEVRGQGTWVLCESILADFPRAIVRITETSLQKKYDVIGDLPAPNNQGGAGTR